MSRSHNYFDRWPPIADDMSKLKPIYRTPHLNVRKYHPDVPAVLQYPYCVMGGAFLNLGPLNGDPIFLARMAEKLQKIAELGNKHRTRPKFFICYDAVTAFT
jgi:hypothetical protein